MINNNIKLVHRDRFSWLLGLLVALYFSAALNPGGEIGLFTAVLKLVLVFSILWILESAFPLSGGQRLIARAVSLSLALLLIASVIWTQPILAVSTSASMIVLLLLTLALTVNALMQTMTVDRDVLSAGIFGYAALIVLFAALYSIFLTVSPESFSFNTAYLNDFSAADSKSAVPLYFSMVTITTLGYGDISPASAATQLIATCQAFAGQIYLTILIARLVGLHILSRGKTI